MKRARYILVSLLVVTGLFGASHATAGREQVAPASPGPQRAIAESGLLQVFRQYVAQGLGKEESQVVVSRFRVRGNRALPPGNRRFDLYQKGMGGLRGPVRLMALVSVDGLLRSRVELSGWVDVFERVLCASRDLKRGEILGRGDVRLARKNLSRLSSRGLTHPEQVIGLRVKHQIREGTPLKEWMLEKSPLVKRGDRVTILAESGGLRVTVPGKVLEKGYLGELVRVQNTMSKKQVHARVLDPQTVVVEF